MNKECIRCKTIKPTDNFYKDKTCKDGYVRKCRRCYEEIRKEKKLANPEIHLKRTQNFWLKHRYGITLEYYEELFKKQNGKCAICSKSHSGNIRNKAFCVDHCHKTGKIRGLLCMSCNRSLGQFNDSAELLRIAANYIELNGE